MNAQKAWLIAITLSVMIGLSACSKQPLEKQEAKQSTNEGLNEWNYWPSLPASTLSIDPQVEIGRKLFSLYLQQFELDITEKALQLTDFKILDTSLAEESQKCSKDLGIESLVNVKYSVKPVKYPNSDWLAGSGNYNSTGWIIDKTTVIAIYKKGNSYSFKSLGNPPCSGIAKDGSTIP